MTAWRVRRGPSDPDSSSNDFVIEDSLGYLLNRASRGMAQELSDELRPAGVGIGQWAVLLFLWSRDGMSQAELSRVVAIEPPTMVGTIDRMVRDGLVERRPDPSDGRISRIHLTPRGRELRDELVPRAVAINERTLARLGPDDGPTLMRILQRLIEEAPAAKRSFKSLGVAASDGRGPRRWITRPR